VSDEHVVSRWLERRLGQPVANLGVAGYGTAQELIVLKTEAMLLEPQVVIWFFFEGNDLYNDEEFENALIAMREKRVRVWTSRHGPGRGPRLDSVAAPGPLRGLLPDRKAALSQPHQPSA
jgi:hypothetical protein